MPETESWGTLVWEKRDPIPAKSPGWKLPAYPNASDRGGVVYRLRFPAEGVCYSYIGLGGSTVRERLAQHLRDKRRAAKPQRLMQERLGEGPIDVWTLSRASTLDLLGERVEATGADKFNLLLFESAAVVYAVRRLQAEVLLNRPKSLPPGTHTKGVKPVGPPSP